MTVAELTVRLPEATLRRLEQAAALTRRTIDDILSSAVDVALIAPSDLPQDLAGELGAMRMLSDKALQTAAKPVLTKSERKRLEQLNHYRWRAFPDGRQSMQSRPSCLDRYEWAVLRRAQALSILPRAWLCIPVCVKPGHWPVTTVHIPRWLRDLVHERAQGRCEYCSDRSSRCRCGPRSVDQLIRSRCNCSDEGPDQP